MDTKNIILRLLKKKATLKTSDIIIYTGLSRAYTNRCLKQLQDEGKIILIGKANKAHYILATRKAVQQSTEPFFQRMFTNKDINEHTVLEEIKKTTRIFIDLPGPLCSILSYAFSEMLNNAIEHSRSSHITVSMQRDTHGIYFKVIDKGIGIFNNIKSKYHLHNELEAIEQLLKGKETTMPHAHSGEGIFFTSKALTKLVIQSSHKKLIFDNLLNDIFIRHIRDTKGTKVYGALSLDWDTNLTELFKQYTDTSFKFNKTMVAVKLYKMDSEYISRSQARRIVMGLEKFKTIVLDFKDVETVGQAFADEVFRVWQKNHPHIKILRKNTNENVEFMIQRSCT